MIRDRIKRLVVFIMTLCTILCSIPSDVFAIDNIDFFVNSSHIIAFPSTNGSIFYNNYNRISLKLSIENSDNTISEYSFRGEAKKSSNSDIDYDVSYTCLDDNSIEFDMYYDDGITADGNGVSSSSCYYCNHVNELSSKNLFNLMCAIISLNNGNTYNFDIDYIGDSVESAWEPKWELKVKIPYYDLDTSITNTIKDEILAYASYDTFNPTNINEVSKFPKKTTNLEVSNEFISLKYISGVTNGYTCNHSKLSLILDNELVVRQFIEDCIDTSKLYYFNDNDYGIYELPLSMTCSNLAVTYSNEYSSYDIYNNSPSNKYIYQGINYFNCYTTFDISLNDNLKIPLIEEYDDYFSTSITKWELDEDLGKLLICIDSSEIIRLNDNIDITYSTYNLNGTSIDYEYLKEGCSLQKGKTYLINNIEYSENNNNYKWHFNNATTVDDKLYAKVYINNILQEDMFIGKTPVSSFFHFYEFYADNNYIVQSIKAESGDLSVYLIDETAIGKVILRNYFTNDLIGYYSIENFQFPSGYEYFINNRVKVEGYERIIDASYISTYAKEGDIFYGVPSSVYTSYKLMSTGDLIGNVESVFDNDKVHTLTDSGNMYIYIENKPYKVSNTEVPTIDGVTYSFCIDKYGNKINELLDVSNELYINYDDYFVVDILKETCESRQESINISENTVFSWSNGINLYNYLNSNNISTTDKYVIPNVFNGIKIDMKNLSPSDDWNWNSKFCISSEDGGDIVDLRNITDTTFGGVIIRNTRGESIELWKDSNGVLYGGYYSYSYNKYYKGDSTYNLDDLLSTDFPNISIDDNYIVTIDLSAFDNYKLYQANNLQNISEKVQFKSLASTKGYYNTNELGHKFEGANWIKLNKPTNQNDLNDLINNAINKIDLGTPLLNNIGTIKKCECLRNPYICTGVDSKAYKLDIIYGNAPVIKNITDSYNEIVYEDSTSQTVEGNLEFKASDIDGDLVKVTIDGVVDYTPDTNNEVIKIIVADDQEHTIVATDEAGNTTTVTVTVNRPTTPPTPSTSHSPVVKDIGVVPNVEISGNNVYESIGDLELEVTDEDGDLKQLVVKDDTTGTVDTVYPDADNKINHTIVEGDVTKEYTIEAEDNEGNKTTLNIKVIPLSLFKITIQGYMRNTEDIAIPNADISLDMDDLPEILSREVSLANNFNMLPLAKFTLMNVGSTKQTDVDGYFKFEDVSLDNHVLSASVGANNAYKMQIDLTDKSKVKALVSESNLGNFSVSSNSIINDRSIVFTVNARECANHIHSHKYGEETDSKCAESGYLEVIDYCPTCGTEWSRTKDWKSVLGHWFENDWSKVNNVTDALINGAENTIVYNGVDDVYIRTCHRPVSKCLGTTNAYELKTVASTPTPSPDPTPTPTPDPVTKYTVTVLDKYGDLDAIERCKDEYTNGQYYRYEAVEKVGYVVSGNSVYEGVVNEDITLTFIYDKVVDDEPTDIEDIPTVSDKALIKVFDKYGDIKSLRKIYTVDFGTEYSYKAKPRNNYKVVGKSTISGVADEPVIEVVFEYEPDIQDDSVPDPDKPVPTPVPSPKPEPEPEPGEEEDVEIPKTGDFGYSLSIVCILAAVVTLLLRKKKK